MVHIKFIESVIDVHAGKHGTRGDTRRISAAGRGLKTGIGLRS